MWDPWGYKGVTRPQLSPAAATLLLSIREALGSAGGGSTQEVHEAQWFDLPFTSAPVFEPSVMLTALLFLKTHLITVTSIASLALTAPPDAKPPAELPSRHFHNSQGGQHFR